MAHRKLTEGCTVSMRKAARSRIIRKTTDASNLRAVAEHFPEFIEIKNPTPTERAQGVLMTATLTSRGLAYITPRKIARKIAIEVRA